MKSIAFVKTSSLGDVIHHMPSVSDARRAWPDAHIAWVVEENYAPLARLHPAVDEVIPVAVRRWRGQFWRRSAWRELAAFLETVRRRRFDAVVDTQGLLRSALLTRGLRGVRHGYAPGSAREPAAAAFYDRRHRVSRDWHAVARNRALTGLALGHAVEGDPRFGLERKAQAGPRYAVLLHGSAQAAKTWPEAGWLAVGRSLEAAGLQIVIPGGSEEERTRAHRLAAPLASARVPDPQPLDGMAALIGGAAVVVGLDTGLSHLASAMGVPLVAIFTASTPELTGPVGSGPIAVLGRKGEAPAPAIVGAAALAMVGRRID